MARTPEVFQLQSSPTAYCNLPRRRRFKRPGRGFSAIDYVHASDPIHSTRRTSTALGSATPKLRSCNDLFRGPAKFLTLGGLHYTSTKGVHPPRSGDCPSAVQKTGGDPSVYLARHSGCLPDCSAPRFTRRVGMVSIRPLARWGSAPSVDAAVEAAAVRKR